MKNQILVSNSLLDVSHNAGGVQNTTNTTNTTKAASIVEVGTVLANMAHYGYVPSGEALEQISAMASSALVDFWKDLEPSLKVLTGSDRNMDDFVVYKNFPKEVLDMSAAKYRFNQTLIYLGLPQKFVAQGETERADMQKSGRLATQSARCG